MKILQNDEKIQFKKRIIYFFNIEFKNLFQKNDEFIEGYINKANKLIFEEEKIRISILGFYNAGKSYLIYSFIGDDLLPVDEDECTRILICIRYYNSNELILYKANLKKDYYNFNIYSFIEDNTFNKIKILDKLDIPEEIKYKIEFFDMPGIKNFESIFKDNETFGKIICISKLFFFVNPIDKTIMTYQPIKLYLN